MATLDQLLNWAADQATSLEADMRWVSPEGGFGGYWKAEQPELAATIRARATSALDFLERYAGTHSQWSVRAQQVFDNDGERQSMESGARAIADVLREWSAQVRAGIAVPHNLDALGARGVASTDLMEQVRTLTADKSVHPAAPVLLAGAALEIALRSSVDELALGLDERPSITAYARRLRSEGMLSAQDMKDVEQMAGIRNTAAHGDFEDLSRERVGLLEQQVNMFLRRLGTLLDAGPLDDTAAQEPTHVVSESN